MMNVKQKVQRIVLFLLIAATGYVVDDSVKAYSCKTFSSTTTSNTDLFGTPPQLQSIEQVVDGEKDTPVNSMNPGAMPDHSELLKLLKQSLPSSIDNSKDTALSKSSSSMLSIKEEQKYLKRTREDAYNKQLDFIVKLVTLLTFTVDYIVPVIKAAVIKAAVIIAAKVAVIKAGEEEGKGKDGKTHSPSAPSEGKAQDEEKEKLSPPVPSKGKAQDEEIPLCVRFLLFLLFQYLK